MVAVTKMDIQGVVNPCLILVHFFSSLFFLFMEYGCLNEWLPLSVGLW